MKLFSVSILRFALLFFTVFFILSAAGQYLFVRSQSEGIIIRQSKEDADNINRAVAYDGGVDLKHFNQAWIDAGDYAVVLNDGTVLDVEVSLPRSVVPPGLLPPVECPVLSDAVFSKPTTVSYAGGARHPEKWTLLGKRLDKGYWLFGISEYNEADNPERILRDNITLIGSTIGTARAANVSSFDVNLSWVLVDDHGSLIEASGRIPLKTDAMQIGAMSRALPSRTLGDKSLFVYYSPITDKTGHPAGMAIIPTDAKQTNVALSNIVYFDGSVALLSVLIFLAVALVYSQRHEKEKREIRQAFQHYFSPQILEAILKEPDRLRLGGQRREVTVLFSDIRSFTTVVERLAPQQLTRLMQEYFTEMTEAVLATDGIIDKFVGDALMAFWGAPIEQPDQADRAVKAALDMTERLHRLQEKWTTEGLPALDIGIGINLGIATIGNFGSAKRFDYTVIGDTVNAASRLEALTREHNTHIIISESTRKQLTMAITSRDLGEVTVKGKEEPVHVYEVLSWSGAPSGRGATS